MYSGCGQEMGGPSLALPPQQTEVDGPEVGGQVGEDQLSDAAFLMEIESLPENLPEGAELLDGGVNPVFGGGDFQRSVHHKLILQLRQSTGGVHHISPRSDRMQPRQ